MFKTTVGNYSIKITISLPCVYTQKVQVQENYYINFKVN